MFNLTECRFQEGLLGISSLYFDNFFKPLVPDRIQVKNKIEGTPILKLAMVKRL